jgi:hypothetical protein
VAEFAELAMVDGFIPWGIGGFAFPSLYSLLFHQVVDVGHHKPGDFVGGLAPVD